MTIENTAWQLEDFVDSLVVELDKTRETLAVKAVNKPLSYSVKEVSLDLQTFPSYDGDQVRFAVSDPGLGIPAPEQRRIFEKFYRLDPDMTHGIGGTGLGLYICRELVRRVGGRIWVESQEGHGSTFFVELPLAHDRTPTKKKRPSQARAA